MILSATESAAQQAPAQKSPAQARAASSPKPAKTPKPAQQIIKKQAMPKVVPRVLEKANPENTRILVSLSKQRAYLYAGDEIAIDTPVSTGKRKGMTPVGKFTILEKDANHSSSIYGNFVNARGEIVRAGVSTKVDSAPSGTRFQGAPMKYFMRIDWHGVGLHVGHLPGYPASHGCIRLPAEIAPLIYHKVKIGTPVEIVE